MYPSHAQAFAAAPSTAVPAGPATMPAAAGAAGLIPVFARALGSWRLTLERQPLSPPELTARYDRAAAGWGRTIDRLDVPRAYADLLRTALEHAPMLGPGPIRALDCGAGTGALSLALATAVDIPLQLDVLDLSVGMLERAGERFQAAGLSPALHRGDVQAMPFGDAAFDVVMAAHLLEHLPDPRRALAEMVRVVRPGGLVVVCLTRRTVLGLYIHLRWRTHMVSDADAIAWLQGAGLEAVQPLRSGRGGILRRLSLAYVGTRPF